MDHEERPNVFFAFHFISFGMMIALSMAGNLVTMYLCFEMVTLSTVPLVLHELSKEAVAAGMKYMFYSIGGALMGLLRGLLRLSLHVRGRIFRAGRLHRSGEACRAREILPLRGDPGDHRLRHEGRSLPDARLAADGASDRARTGVRAAFRHRRQGRRHRHHPPGLLSRSERTSSAGPGSRRPG